MIQPTVSPLPRFFRVCDRIVIGGILFLIVFTPLAFGAVHPWAFSLMEGVIFFLVMIWMGKLLLSSSSLPSLFLRFLPLFLFMGVLFFQSLALPPALLHFLSPATYTFYTHSLPGWPERMPYENLASQESDSSESRQESSAPVWIVLPTPEERGRDARPPLARNETLEEQAGMQDPRLGETTRRSAVLQLWTTEVWRPLSLAPALTATDLLKFLAYVSFFFLVLCYPFSSSSDTERFYRTVLIVVLCSGLLVAFIGIVQQFSWNGEILWFFVPYDWGAARPGETLGASGPFILYNHFANYLALVFPLALVGFIAPRFLVSQERRRAFMLFCGLLVFVLFTAILLSLSRGGWIGTALGTGVLLGVLFSLPEEKKPSLLRRSNKSVVRLAVAGLILLTVTLFFMGSSGRGGVDVRLEQTVMRERSLWDRVSVWQDSLKIVRDFPWFGVGLGAWPEVFPHYRQLPRTSFFYREAHNDYLELVAETGLVGFGLLAWFFWRAGRRLVRSFPLLSPRVVPISVALVTTLGIMAFHEFFDFNLQIPANAFLFTLLFALASRLTESSAPLTPKAQSRLQMGVVVGGGIVAAVLCVLALRQDKLPYPRNLKEPTSIPEARALLLSYPARSSLHLSLFRLLKDKGSPASQLKELEIAIWLDPGNPAARDLYAMTLFQRGKEKEGFEEITRSVFSSPLASTHPYLNWRLVPWLSEAEQKAIEQGFQQAVALGDENAAIGLGIFYNTLGRFAEEGQVYEEVAEQEREPDMRLQYLLGAGVAYARGENREKAERLFRQAIAVAPQDYQAYQYLATWVFAPQGNMTSAAAVVAEGIQKGADAFSLYLGLEDAARLTNNGEAAKAALQQALLLRPRAFEAHLRLGFWYLQEKNFERAALSAQRAIEANSTSALAFFYLGLAEEGRYQLSAAQKAYDRAVTLAPNEVGFQQYYQAFLQRVAKDGER